MNNDQTTKTMQNARRILSLRTASDRRNRREAAAGAARNSSPDPVAG